MEQLNNHEKWMVCAGVLAGFGIDADYLNHIDKLLEAEEALAKMEKEKMDMNVDLCDCCHKPIERDRSLTGGCKTTYIVKIKRIDEMYTLAGFAKNKRRLELCKSCMNRIGEMLQEEALAKMEKENDR